MYMYVAILIKEKETVNLRVLGHGKSFRVVNWEGLEGEKGEET